jgi:opacity protein-like surface antigen
MKNFLSAAVIVLLSLLQSESYAAEVVSFDGIYWGLGGTYSKAENQATLLLNNQSKSQKNNGWGGLVIFGSGKIASAHTVYLGGELLLDIRKSKQFEVNFGPEKANVKNSGLIPSFAFRAGLLEAGAVFMIFGKAGCYFSKSTIELSGGDESTRLNVSKVAPFFGAGVEGIFWKKYALRLDYEYRLKNEKKNNKYKLELGNTSNLRVMFVWHIKF